MTHEQAIEHLRRRDQRLRAAEASPITDERIKAICLAHGYKEKRQEDGSMDLNPYVYAAARALLAAAGLNDEPTPGAWTKCADRLPERAGLYLVLRADGSITVDEFNPLAPEGSPFWPGSPVEWIGALAPHPEPLARIAILTSKVQAALSSSAVGVAA